MCFHVSEFPSTLIHFNMFLCLNEDKSAYGTHMGFHSWTFGVLRWLYDGRNTEGNLEDLFGLLCDRHIVDEEIEK